MPGMVGKQRWNGRIRLLVTDGLLPNDGDNNPHPTLPDLEDAATLGCLLQLVREARQEPWYYPTAQVYGGQVLWLVERPVRERQTLHESEASALVAALEAAP
jgi:hypothetical protein